MRRFGLAACLLALACPAMAQIDKAAEKELTAGYQKIIALMKKKDVKGVMNYMTPDVTMVEMGQTMTRAQFEPMFKQQIAGTEIQSAAIKFSKLVVKGATANTEYTESMKAKIKTPDGKTGMMAMKSKYRTAFKKIGGVWKMHRSETIGTPEMTLNGKPFSMGAPSGGAAPK